MDAGDRQADRGEADRTASDPGPGPPDGSDRGAMPDREVERRGHDAARPTESAEPGGDQTIAAGTATLGAPGLAAGASPRTEPPTPTAVDRPVGAGDGAAVPRRIGRFTILGELGSGGFGNVYLAHDPKLDRDVALKLPRMEILSSHDSRRRFVAEAQVAARLDHPNIVPIYDVGELWDEAGDGGVFIASAYCRDGSLARWIERQGAAIPPAVTARLMVGLADGVQYLHDLGILHRDLKPSNVLLHPLGGSGSTPRLPAAGQGAGRSDSGSGHPSGQPAGPALDFIPRVADFGLAKLLDQPIDQTLSGVPIGSPPYMSPEQAMGKVRELGPATDVYGLGAILYVLLCGRPPFRGETALETIQHVILDEPTPPRRLRRALPRDLETICLSCLRKEPARRYESARALCADLDRFLRGEPVRARPISTTERVAKWVHRRPLTAALIAALSLALVAGTGGILWQWREAVAARDALRIQVQIRQRAEEGERRYARTAESEAYLARINLAGRNWDDANIDRVRQLLDQTTPQAGRPDLRGFEWYYLDRLSRGGGFTLSGHVATVTSLAYNRAGTILASAGADGTVKLWTADPTRLLRTLTASKHAVDCIAFNPDGRTLAAGGSEGVVFIWDVATGGLVAKHRSHDGHVLGVAYHPDGQTLATVGRDAKLVISAARDGRPIRVLSGYRGPVLAVAYSRDGHFVAAGGQDGVIRLWDPAETRAAKEWDGQGQLVRRLAFSPDGRFLAVAGGDGAVRLRDVASGSVVRSFHRSGGPVNGIAFSPDGQRLASGGLDQVVTLWDLSGRILRTFRGHRSPILDVTYRPDGQTIASAGGDDHTVKLWDAEADQEAERIPAHDGPVHSLQYSPDGTRLASGGEDGVVDLWDVDTRRLIASSRAHTGPVWSVAFSPDGSTVASAGNDASVVLWRWREQTSRSLAGHTGPVKAVVFDPDGRMLASASGLDPLIRFWDATTGLARRTLPSQEGRILDLALSPDGRWMAAACEDGNVKVWSPPGGDRPPQVLPAHSSAVLSIAISPDGRKLASGSFDQAVMIWDLEKGARIRTLEGHRQTVYDLAFSGDGARLVSSDLDRSLILWDCALGRELLTLRGSSGSFLSVAFRPDSRQLAAGDEQGTIRLFDGAKPRGVDAPDGPRAADPPPNAPPAPPRRSGPS